MSKNHNEQMDLRTWYTTNLGQLLSQFENQILNDVIPNLYGYYLLQLGELTSHYNLKNNRILNTFFLCEPNNASIRPHAYSDYAKMPIASASIDALFLPHVVEYLSQLELMMNEAERILIPEGYLIIIGFNPFSLWGLWNFFKRCCKLPNLGKFKSLMTISDTLLKLNMDIVSIKTCFYRPPLSCKIWLKRLRFFEILGQLCCPKWGACYVIVAKKRVVPLSPIRLHWWSQLTNIGKQMVAPTARNYNRDKTY